MDWLQFISSMTASVVTLGFPIALVVIVAIFRRDIRRLLPGLRLKRGDTEISFRLEKAEQDAKALPAPQQQPTEAIPTPEEDERFNQLVKLSPRSAMLEERNALNEALIRRLEEVPGVPVGAKLSMLKATRILRERKLIDAHTSAILDDLRNVGNAAAHLSGPITEEDARRFRRLSRQVIAQLSFG